MKNVLGAAVLAIAAIAVPVSFAAEEEHTGHEQGMDHGPAHQLHGVVNSVNADAGRVNITHDPVESLKWPKMKMNFKVHDPALLKDVKSGMTVDFEIVKMGNEYHVTKIVPTK
jgi:Cu(I)/Ag(I) efflux system periplasmic protein CusF